MRRILIVALIGVIGAPAVARGQAVDAAEGLGAQYPQLRLPPRQYPPQFPPQSPPPSPGPFRPGLPPGPLTETEWGRWLLRERDRASLCGKVAIFSGLLAAGGLAAALKNPATPSPAELAAGVTGKRETFAHVVGVSTFLGGGLTFLTTLRCNAFSQQVVRELEWEGQRRGFAPPVPPPMTTREWVARVAGARATASVGKWMTMGGSAVMLLAGTAIRDYQPRPDQRNLARLGPGIVPFLIGYGFTLGGSTLWVSGAADVRSLEKRQPPPGTTVSLAPTSGGIGIGGVIRF
jgi:hypothetical protein